MLPTSSQVRERGLFYFGQRAVLLGALGVCLFGAAAFLVSDEPDMASELAGGLLLLCGVAALLGFLSRHRLAVDRDGITVPYGAPWRNAKIPYSRMSGVSLTRDETGWEFRFQDGRGRSWRLRLFAFESPEDALRMLSQVGGQPGGPGAQIGR